MCDNGSFETFLPDKLEDLTSATGHLSMYVCLSIYTNIVGIGRD